MSNITDALPISKKDLSELIKRIDSLEKGNIKFPNYNEGIIITGNAAHAYECPSDGFVVCSAVNMGDVLINGIAVGKVDYASTTTHFVKKGYIVKVTSTNTPRITFFPFL